MVRFVCSRPQPRRAWGPAAVAKASALRVLSGPIRSWGTASAGSGDLGSPAATPAFEPGGVDAELRAALVESGFPVRSKP